MGELRGTPLIGFAGGPFTVASYMVEGGSSKELAKLKALMFSDPKAYHMLLEKLSTLTAAYLVEQVRQGADAVTIMDSWAGYLSPADYREYVLPHTRSMLTISGGGVPSSVTTRPETYTTPRSRSGRSSRSTCRVSSRNLSM